MQLLPTPASSFESGKDRNDDATDHQYTEWREHDLDEHLQQDIRLSYDQPRTGKITATLYSATDHSLAVLAHRQGSIDGFSWPVSVQGKARHAVNGHSPSQGA
jgi:hypothetical protein